MAAIRASSCNVNYFAYGPNLSIQNLEKIVGRVSKLGVGILKEYAFSFNKENDNGSGEANIIYDTNSFVEGVVYELNAYQISVLNDEYKRSSKDFKELEVSVFMLGMGSSVKAVTYIASHSLVSKKPLIPDLFHFDSVYFGAIQSKLSSDYVGAILRSSNGLRLC